MKTDYRISALKRELKKLEAQKKELEGVSRTALDKSFVARHYTQVVNNIKTTQATIKELEAHA